MPALRLTAPQWQALAALDPAVPRHPVDLRQRHGVREATLAALCVPTPARPALVRLLELKPATWLKVPYIPFYLRTLDGTAALATRQRKNRLAGDVRR